MTVFISHDFRDSASHCLTITPNDVRALLGVLERDRNVSKGIVTTTGEFAPGVYDEFKDFMPHRLELRNGTQLKEWLMEISNEQR